jgi:hypothetical protein
MRSRQFVILGASVVVLGAGTGAALAGEVAAPELSAPAGSGIPTAAPSVVAGAFPVLSGPRRSADMLPASATTALSTPGSFGTHYGVNLGLSRLAGVVVGGTSVWLVPGSSGSCIWLSSGGGSCGENQSIAAEGLAVALVPVSGAPATLIGIAPAHASVTASSKTAGDTTVALSGEAFTLSAAGRTSYTVHTPAGQATTQLPTGTPPTTPTR